MRPALLLLLLAPAAAAQTTPVDGDPSDLAAFVGEWVGGYECEDTGRSGTVVFRLAPGADSVRAVVLMTPRPTEADPVPATIPLAVHHVAVTGRSFRGSLERYDDPEWGVELEAEFGGALAHDDHVEGYFRAAGTQIDTAPFCGRWWATRMADTPAP